MPTGYTADIVDGKPVTFQEFAMRCARAFAPEPELRDSPAIMESHAHSGCLRCTPRKEAQSNSKPGQKRRAA